MIGPAPYLTFWQVAEKWADELKKPVMDVIQIMRVHATYKYPHPYPCPVPALLVWPTACFSAKGEIDEITIFNANRMVEKEHAPPIEDIKQGMSKYRTKYRTPEYNAAEAFFNSSVCPPEPTEEIKNHLSLLAIQREDFKNWCLVEGEPLPKFWFNTIDDQIPEVQPSKERRNDLLSEEMDEVIKELGDKSSPKTIMKKLQEYAGSPGSCIVEAIPEGVVWKNSLGNKKRLDFEALGKRLSRKRTITDDYRQ